MLAIIPVDFNPILVRFKQASQVTQSGSPRNFNPILVRFKQIFSGVLSVIGAHFNPILVRFKLGTAADTVARHPVFQSYFSPIQTSVTATGKPFVLSFQSYFSPIQTLGTLNP